MTAAAAPASAPALVHEARREVVLPGLAVWGATLLAALSLSPVMASGAWFGATLLAVTVVTVVGAGSTWLRVPVALVPLAQAVALFCVLVSRFTTGAPLGFVPTGDSLRMLQDVLAQGVHDANLYAPPVPVTEGITAVAALGLGCVAIVVTAFQLSMRAPVIAGLCLVAVYVVPSLVLDDGSPWWSFALVATGFLLLLATDERIGLASWGRMLRRSEGRAGSAFSGLSSAALRLGAAAVAAAVILPVLVPALTDVVLGRHDTGIGGSPGDGSGSGPGQRLGLDPFVYLRQQLRQESSQIVLTYRSDAARPDYLRAVALTTYEGETWKPGTFDPGIATPVDQGVPIETDLGAALAERSRRVTTTVTSAGLVTPYLPVPSHLTGVAIDGGQWFLDPGTRTVFGENSDTTTDGRTWTATSLAVDPTGAELAAAPPDTAADDTDRLRRAAIPERLRTLAVQKTASAGSDYDKARALESWLRTDFTYSLDVASNDDPQAPSYLDQFLDAKRGYCQQFAATMALMAESLGIPARVVVGFTAGQRQPDGTWVVRGSDAHAWPELFFAGIGWQRFEPTPASGGAGIALPDYSTGQNPGPSVSASGGTGATGSSVKPIRDERDSGGAVIDLPSATTSADTWRLRGLLVLLVAGLLVALVPAVWRVVRRRRRLSAQAEVEDMWEELRDTARDLGIPWSTAQTPRQAVASVLDHEHLRGEARDALVRVGRATERSRYAPQAPSTQGLADDVTTVRAALLRRAERPVRWRAALLPASLRRREDERV